MLSRREFIKQAYLLGGMAALYNLGIPFAEAAFSVDDITYPESVDSIDESTSVDGIDNDYVLPCTNAEHSLTTASSGVDECSRYPGTQILAQQIAYGGASTDICSVKFYLQSVGTPNYSFYAYIFSNDSGTDLPDALLGTSDAVNLASLPGSETEVIFPFSTPVPLTNGLTYFVCVGRYGNNADNYIAANRFGTASLIRRWDANNTIWTGYATTKTLRLILYSTGA